MRIDERDCAILAELQQHGDLANVELARRIGLSPAATLRRVARLHDGGAITAVRAVVAPEQVGLTVQAFVMITLARHSDDADAAFSAALAAMPEVLRADAISGNHDALLHVATTDVPALQQLLLALQRAGAARLVTMLRLASHKCSAAVPAHPDR